MPTFFIDRNLGRYKFPNILRESGIDLEVHDDHFSQDILDVEWIPQVAQKGWVIVTFDKRIRLKPHEKEVVIVSSAMLLCLSSGRASMEEIAHHFVNSKTKIERFLELNSAPFIATLSRPKLQIGLPRPGELRRVYPK